MSGRSERRESEIRRLLQPDLIVDHLFDIPLEELKQKRIQGIIFDLDNTIIAWSGNEMEADIVSWLHGLKTRGFQIYIVSNSLKNRVKKIADMLRVGYTARAGKPMSGGFFKALQYFSLDGERVAVVGDQLLTDVLGGNRIGAFTILVKPLGENEFFTTKLTRKLEKILLKKRKK